MEGGKPGDSGDAAAVTAAVSPRKVTDEQVEELVRRSLQVCATVAAVCLCWGLLRTD